jgi:hypothetical protein
MNILIISLLLICIAFIIYLYLLLKPNHESFYEAFNSSCTELDLPMVVRIKHTLDGQHQYITSTDETTLLSNDSDNTITINVIESGDCEEECKIYKVIFVQHDKYLKAVRTEEEPGNDVGPGGPGGPGNDVGPGGPGGPHCGRNSSYQLEWVSTSDEDQDNHELHFIIKQKPNNKYVILKAHGQPIDPVAVVNEESTLPDTPIYSMPLTNYCFENTTSDPLMSDSSVTAGGHPGVSLYVHPEFYLGVDLNNLKLECAIESDEQTMQNYYWTLEDSSIQIQSQPTQTTETPSVDSDPQTQVNETDPCVFFNSYRAELGQGLANHPAVGEECLDACINCEGTNHTNCIEYCLLSLLDENGSDQECPAICSVGDGRVNDIRCPHLESPEDVAPDQQHGVWPRNCCQTLFEKCP